MRTLRLSLAGAAIVAFLAVGAVPAGAQGQPMVVSGPDYAWVEAIEEHCSFPAPTVGTDDVHRWVRYDATCEMVYSDPRVSGTYHIKYEWRDCLPSGWSGSTCVTWASQKAEGPDGTWSGWANGIIGPDGVARWLEVLTGSAGYEGLTFIVHGLGEDETGVPRKVGLIYQGTPPPTEPAK